MFFTSVQSYTYSRIERISGVRIALVLLVEARQFNEDYIANRVNLIKRTRLA